MTPKQQAQKIVDYEARRDAQGNIKLYKLPPGDGGGPTGSYEYSGLNRRYHPEILDKIIKLVEAKLHKEAEDIAVDYIRKYTDKNASYSTVPAIQFALRDAAFNRGPTGSVKIMQIALGVDADGKVGPKTLAALKAADANPREFIQAFRVAREQYERKVAGYRENFWRGLTARWNRQEADSLKAL